MNSYEFKILKQCSRKNLDNEKSIILFLQMGISSSRAEQILAYK